MNSTVSSVETEKGNSEINKKMQDLLDKFSSTKFRPLDAKKYTWDKTRPENVDLDNTLIDAVHFATLIESNAPAAAQRLLDAADRSDAPWLTRFISNAWLPQENSHWIPFYEYLHFTGLVRKEKLDSEISGVRSREFTIGRDYTAMMAVTYGWLQELLTWHFYQSMYSRILSNNEDRVHIYGVPYDERYGDPVLAQILQDISAQENFHRQFYLTSIRTILKYRPDLKEEFIHALVRFDMPHRTMLPDLPEVAAAKIGRRLGFDSREVLEEITDVSFNAVGHEGVGRAAVRYAAHHRLPYKLEYAAKVLEPFSRVRDSPTNRIIGRLIVNKYGR